PWVGRGGGRTRVDGEGGKQKRRLPVVAGETPLSATPGRRWPRVVVWLCGRRFASDLYCIATCVPAGVGLGCCPGWTPVSALRPAGNAAQSGAWRVVRRGQRAFVCGRKTIAGTEPLPASTRNP